MSGIDSFINYLFCDYLVPGTVLSITDRRDRLPCLGTGHLELNLQVSTVLGVKETEVLYMM